MDDDRLREVLLKVLVNERTGLTYGEANEYLVLNKYCRWRSMNDISISRSLEITDKGLRFIQGVEDE